MATETLSPRNATTTSKVLTLNRETFETKDYWILGDYGIVTICKQRNGEKAEWSVDIDRKDFNRMIDFYNREQIIKPKRKRNE